MVKEFLSLSRAVFVRWAHGQVPTLYFEIYVAAHPISDVPVKCVPTQYSAPRYGIVVYVDDEKMRKAC